ncbi:MAG: ester cyclase, partial [Nitrososphaerales archaeon]
REGFNAMNKHDLDASVSLYAPDALHLHPFPEPSRGKEAIKKENKDFFEAFPDLQLNLSGIISSGNQAAAEFEMKGTNTGPLVTPDGNTLPATNKRVEMNGSAFFRSNDEGLIVEEHFYFDTATFMGQLGIKPPE